MLNKNLFSKLMLLVVAGSVMNVEAMAKKETNAPAKTTANIESFDKILLSIQIVFTLGLLVFAEYNPIELSAIKTLLPSNIDAMSLPEMLAYLGDPKSTPTMNFINLLPKLSLCSMYGLLKVSADKLQQGFSNATTTLFQNSAEAAPGILAKIYESFCLS